MYRRATSGVRSASARLSSSLSRIASSETASVSAPSASSLRNQTNRSKSFSSALRSFRVCSASTRWSHGGSWGSPASLRAQARNSTPVMEKFERKYATMASEHSYKDILTSLPKPGGGEYGKYYSLPALNDPRIDKLPFSVRILLESAIRNCDNYQVTKDDVEKILDWENTSTKQVEIAFKPARVILQDFTGVPVLVDLASMRDAVKNLGSDPSKINPLVPVDLVVDHSIQVDFARSEDAAQKNLELEFKRNKERFTFLKWGSTAFQNMLVVPPGSGIVHQVQDNM